MRLSRRPPTDGPPSPASPIASSAHPRRTSPLRVTTLQGATRRQGGSNATPSAFHGDVGVGDFGSLIANGDES
jgi:hypothetical protein